MAMALDVSGAVRVAAVSSSSSSAAAAASPSSSSPSSSSASFSPFARCRGDPFAAGAKSRRTPSVSSVLPSCCGLKVYAPAAVVLPVSSRTSPRSSSSSASKVLCQQQPAAPTSAGSPANAISEAAAVDDKTWKSLVLDSDIPVLVDFWAPWCGPCRMIAPLIDDLARQYAGRLRCLKLNTDESPNTATEYGIRSIPTVMIFKGGQKKDTVIGAVPKATLISTIEKYLER